MSRRAARTIRQASPAADTTVEQQVSGMRAAVTAVLFDLLTAVKEHGDDPAFAAQAVSRIADGWCASFLAGVEAAAEARAAEIASRLMATPKASQ